MNKKALLCVVVSLVLLGGGAFLAAAERSPQERRLEAHGNMKDGNFKQAYDLLYALAIDPADDPAEVSEDLTRGIECLRRLGREDELDDFREKVIAAHPDNWRLLYTAAKTFNEGNYYGYSIAGKFYRGNRHGNDGRMVYAVERDRVRALQLMQDAAAKQAGEANKNEVGEFWLSFADMMLNRRFGNGAWQLQYLTDLTKLPDYGNPEYYGNSGIGAPVNADGSPVFHALPKSWEDAKTDGQRWRWCLQQASGATPETAARASLQFANFLEGQFDVATMAGYAQPGRFGAESDDDNKDESGPYAVRTLGEDETIARLAIGIRRFKLPEEFNFIHIYQQLGDGAKSSSGELALGQLAQIFENRQQYDRAAEFWKKNIDKYGPGPDPDHYKQKRLDQILGNWMNFDALETEPAGPNGHASIVFRNGKKVSFEATAIDVDKLLADVRAYLKNPPKQLDWQKLDIANIGYRLVTDNQKQYLGKQVAAWDMDVQPPAKHFDKRLKVDVPVKKAGAYLLTAHIDGGNTSQIVLWIADTIIVQKPMDKGSYYFVADAVTGVPIGKASLDFFGWQQTYIPDNHWKVDTKQFADATDGDGQAMVGADREPHDFQWLVTAATAEGRSAYLGFTNVWGGAYQYDADYNQRKVFVITDRPVYRPGQTVKYKIWVGTTKYDQEGASPFANQLFSVKVTDPRNEKLQEKSYPADDYGGMGGELTLAKDATPGQYAIGLGDDRNGSFRVEEYKKPEYEVKVDAPADPVMLGDKITATIEAKYYFGAPVVNAKVKYKVLRTSYSADWYPWAPWDWFYERGYWWFAEDYQWYPGWEEWGMRRPVFWWFGRNNAQPEVVAENEAVIGADGTLKVEIDTGPAKAMFGNTDHKYQITAEVTDESRRTIVGQGEVLVARKPFKVYVWLDRGFYQTGDAIDVNVNAQTLAQKPVKGSGELKLLKVTYQDNKPVETLVQSWPLDTDDQGHARQQIKAAQAGQYRLSYTLKDAKGNSIEGGYVFLIRADNFDGKDFRFNDVELVPDKKEYQPGDSVRLMINTNRENATVLLFVRPTNGIYLPPTILHLKGKSTIQEIGVAKKDMPNFFVEALTIGDGQIFQEMHDLVVPPESRMINVQVTPSNEKYKPGEKATVVFKLTDMAGKPIVGSTVVSIYDKAVEYISGGSNVPEIKAFFWKWLRRHSIQTQASVFRGSNPVFPQSAMTMAELGVFGGAMDSTSDFGLEPGEPGGSGGVFGGGIMDKRQSGGRGAGRVALAANGEMDEKADAAKAGEETSSTSSVDALAATAPAEGMAQATVRTNFADTALWSGSLLTNADGVGQVDLVMPENLTTWKAKVWAMGGGTRVGEGNAEVVTYKNLIVRLQAPRFFVQKDEVVLSANVHNYLKTAKTVKVSLLLSGGCLAPMEGGEGTLTQSVEIPSEGEKRVDWRVKVRSAGQATVRMTALTNEESDATEMSFPAYIHGMLKTDSFSGAIGRDDKSAKLSITVPAERLIPNSRLEIRYSPSVALAMVDALPYLVDYPYDTTDTTINRFLPTVITQKILLGMNLNLKQIQDKRTNLNAQEIGDDKQRAQDWKRNNPPNPGGERNPVFDEALVADMARSGLYKLASMQLSDGGWGWFSGFGEYSQPHTTALVVHGLQIAKANGASVPADMLDRGMKWLKDYQAQQIQLLKNAPGKVIPWKDNADNIDAFVYMVLADGGVQDKQMMDFLYRDRIDLSVYAKAMFGLALSQQNEKDKLAMIVQNCAQFVVNDDADQTAFLKLPDGNTWWYWYGSETESMGYYLKLLARTDPKGAIAPRLAKYLITNRKHGSYWNDTRDTAICIEALADYIRASGEDKPDMTVAILIDGKKRKEVQINADNLFSYDNKLVLTGDEVPAGNHVIEFEKVGTGPLYFNAYLTNFTLEDPITKAGLEIQVQRKFYKRVEVDQKAKVEGSRGQAIDQKVEKYTRQELHDGAELKSGDIVEVEMEIDSKNDYEYVLIEDMKASGFEAVDLRSGYNGNDLNAYMELHDERVCFFARTLARGKHSVSYLLRAEIPGKFSALPTKASALYAPELKANSDEMKLGITD